MCTLRQVPSELVGRAVDDVATPVDEYVEFPEDALNLSHFSRVHGPSVENDPGFKESREKAVS